MSVFMTPAGQQAAESGISDRDENWIFLTLFLCGLRAVCSKLFWVSFVMVQCISIEFWEIVINFKICTLHRRFKLECNIPKFSNVILIHSSRQRGCDWLTYWQPPLRGSGLRQEMLQTPWHWLTDSIDSVVSASPLSIEWMHLIRFWCN